jgi:transposase-like protein
MTAGPSIDPARFLTEQLDQASPDLLRDLLTTFVNALLSAQADAVCGAGHGERTPERVNSRNGYRHRDLDTRVGTLDVAVPKLRQGSLYPDWLLERRKRAERALTSVVATCYLLGVSTRRMDKLVQTLGITGLSKSQVSVMARELDEHVEQFRTRRLEDAGPFTFVAADALVLKVREGGRVVPVHVLVATGVNADGHREILGVQVTSSEDGAGWLAFFRDLTARGLSGVKLVTSDAHAGLVAAIGASLPGAAWQRCRTHYAANLMSATPKSSWGWVKALLHSIYDQPDAEAVHAQFDRVVDALAEKLPRVAEHLEEARADILAFTAFPREVWRQIWSNNPNERLNREIRRRTDVVGIFPDRPSIIRLVGAVLAEQHDEWAEGRRYLGLDVLARSQAVDTDPTEEVTTDLQAITA